MSMQKSSAVLDGRVGSPALYCAAYCKRKHLCCRSLCSPPFAATPLSHDPIFTGWRSSRGLVDLITGAISIRWRLKFRGAGLLTTKIALVRSISALILVVIPSLLSLTVRRDGLGAVLRLLLGLILVLRVVGCSAVTGGGVADPSRAVEWLQASLATPSGGNAADEGGG